MDEEIPPHIYDIFNNLHTFVPQTINYLNTDEGENNGQLNKKIEIIKTKDEIEAWNPYTFQNKVLYKHAETTFSNADILQFKANQKKYNNIRGTWAYKQMVLAATINDLMD